MPEPRQHQLRIAAARADFLEYGAAGAGGVCDLVSASWQRSSAAGVDADVYRVPFHDDIDVDSRLVRCATPVLERLTVDMSEVPVTIALTDACARIVDRRDCSAAVGRVLDRVDFNRGFSFEESSVGTNGVGTVFEVGAAVSVVGSEHFNQSLVQFACTGAPIADPLTGRVAGVLDVSMLAESWNPLVDAVVRSAAAEIGRNLLLDRGHATRALFETYLHADARSGQAVLAFGNSVMVNERARMLLSPEEIDDVGEYARFLMSREEAASRIVSLEGGRRIRLRAKHISSHHEVVGTVVVVELIREDAAGGRHLHAVESAEQSRAVGESGRAGMSSSAWTCAKAEIARCLAEQRNLIVMGEPGTGRTTVLTETFAAHYGQAPILVVDAQSCEPLPVLEIPPCPAGAGSDGPGSDVGESDVAGLVVIRHIDRPAIPSMSGVRALIESASAAGHLVAATMDPAGLPSDPGSYAELLAAFGDSVELPPLRLRGQDLGALIDRTLRELAPRRNTRLSPQAARILAAYTWPQNLTQLRQALGYALSRRPVGEIQSQDLPGFCRTTTSRVLTPLEINERDTIVAALAECGGNRARAARSLGMARSSIYRKIRGYGITGI